LAYLKSEATQSFEGSRLIISMSHDGTILYMPLRGIQAFAAGHHPQCVPGCFVSSVQVEQVLKAMHTVAESGRPVFGIGPPLGVANPSVKK
jgi:hypothetical protein